tara:strand:+ start:1469 stop:2524 length:1056 start_codon:yes stop_codon:yes gene_type:complete
MKLAFQKAYSHLGSTKENPSVGCVVVKNGSVISSGSTSVNGRPHAEINALKGKKNFFGSTMYVTLEPCSHYGKSPPCVNTIIKKGIAKVCYSVLDTDSRTENKAKSILQKKKIKVKIGLLKNEGKNFYKSYFLSKKNKSLPYIDGKIAISKDYFSINKKGKWITNDFSRSKVHLIRSKYDCILSSYKSVNKDNSKLDCRIKGLEHLSPSRAIIDRDLKLKKTLNLYNSTKKIKTYIITSKNNKKKENFFKSKNIVIIKIKDKKKLFSFKNILFSLKQKGYSRILCEAGLYTTNAFLKNNLFYNLYVFKSFKKLNKNGRNSYKNLLSKLKLKDKKKIDVKLFGDELYKLRIK